MFDPTVKLLIRSLLEFPASLSGDDYPRLLNRLLTHFNVIPSGNLSLLASQDQERHLLKYLARHYDERAGDFFLWGTAALPEDRRNDRVSPEDYHRSAFFSFT